GRVPGVGRVGGPAEEVGEGVVAGTVRARAAVLVAVIGAKAAADQAAAVVAVITVKYSVGRMSRRRPAYLKNRNRLIPRQLARIRLRERWCFEQCSHRMGK